MNVSNILSSSKFIKSMFFLAIFIMIFISSISYRHSLLMTESVEQMLHTEDVMNVTKELNINLLNAEIAQKNYIISKDNYFLYPFNESKKDCEVYLVKLKKLANDNAQQIKNIDTIQQLFDTRFDIFNQNLENIKNNIPFIKIIETLKEGTDISNIIYRKIDNVIRLESQTLKNKQAKYEEKIKLTPFFTLLTFLFVLIIFLFSFRKINQDLKKQILAFKQLEITTESIKTAEVVGNFATWHCDYKINKITFSDNQYRMLGLKPNEHDLTLKDIMNFVHTDDVGYFKEQLDIMLTQKQTTDFYYRMIKANDEVHYYLFMGKVITDISGNDVFVGINKDVTERQLNLFNLQARNIKLEQTNNELASFNHIASHDLQEPLRKIQTFISRIKDTEYNNFSEKSQTYFQRIESASSRMRKLIDDLLLFSRASKSEKIFEITNLNELVAHAKLELTEMIEETNAEILSENLPQLNVVPFQIQQLFTNLISNAIKYAKPNEKPVIHINVKTINTNKNPIAELKSNHAYHEISVSDNGIGFAQEYAKDIFDLFYRLHQDSEYQGTGIGLAICKKIMENHEGYIEAFSETGKGTQVKFYLPA